MRVCKDAQRAAWMRSITLIRTNMYIDVDVDMDIHRHIQWRERERERESYGREFYLKNPTPIGSRPSGLIGLCRQHTKPHPPNTQGKAGETRKPQKGAAGKEGTSLVRRRVQDWINMTLYQGEDEKLLLPCDIPVTTCSISLAENQRPA